MTACLLLGSAPADAEQEYAGAAACSPCHPQQFQAQSLSGHARTLHRAARHPLAASFATVSGLKRPPKFVFAFKRQGEVFRMEIGDGTNSVEIPLEWAFGSGTHGVTFVTHMGGGSYLEHAFSYYAGYGAWDLTPGHQRLPAGALMEAAGQLFGSKNGGKDIRACFRCHSTGPITASQGEIKVKEPGVRCEACHGPGKLHASKASGQSIRNPGLLSAERQLELCGSCHRPPGGTEASNDFTDPWNVRHQPPYLAQSRCFRESSGALSCINCHAPHEPLRRRDAAHYRGRCLACHGQAQHPPAAACGSLKSADCTACHMPEVAPDARLKFRNHWIGVYRAGFPLVPMR